MDHAANQNRITHKLKLSKLHEQKYSTNLTCALRVRCNGDVICEKIA